MKFAFITRLSAAAFATAALLLSACATAPTTNSAPANASRNESIIVVKDAWARPTMGQVMGNQGSMGNMGGHGGMHGSMSGSTGPVSAAYMTIENTGNASDRLMSATGDIAEKIEVHETKSKDGMMVMQEVKEGIEIPAGGSVLLKPGGYHIMLIGVKRELNVGDTFKLTLKFQSGKEMPVEVTVREP